MGAGQADGEIGATLVASCVARRTAPARTGDNAVRRMKRKWPPGIAAWILALGAYAAVNGAVALGNWASYAGGTRLYYSISFAAGAVAAAVGGLLLLERVASVLAAWVAPAAVGVLAANQIAGLLLNTILCFTPG